jgi:hypothetical protein
LNLLLTFIVIVIVIDREITIFTEDGIIEITGTIILVVCLLRCVQYAIQSRLQRGRYFWLASVLIFFTVIRKELNYLPDLLVSSDFLLLSYSYDWWEDRVLLVIHLVTIGFLIYGWRYFWAVLKATPVALYLGVAVLAALQYMGENAIGFPESVGLMVEELTEAIIYAVALAYLWKFKLVTFEAKLLTEPDFATTSAN